MLASLTSFAATQDVGLSWGGADASTGFADGSVGDPRIQTGVTRRYFRRARMPASQTPLASERRRLGSKSCAHRPRPMQRVAAGVGTCFGRRHVGSAMGRSSSARA
jgi:hypothetical protein